MRMLVERLWQSTLYRWLAVLVVLLLLVIFFRNERLFPSYDKPGPFNPPVVPAFKCVVEQSVMPPVDVHAEAWMREVHRLNVLPWQKKRHDEAIDLLKRASERDYWPAMHPLAWRYMTQPTWRHSRGSALRLVRRGMHLGYPDAYYRMGLYFLEGWGVPADRDMAYAFWQKAAYMGNPAAMAELAKVISTKQNNTIGNDLVNLPVAKQMLECAMAQGYGDAAAILAGIIEIPKADNGTVLGPVTAETDARSQRILQDGVKLGCSKCALLLGIRFNGAWDWDDIKSNGLRATFYMALASELEGSSTLHLPDIDKVMPLPPATLPPVADNYRVALDLVLGRVSVVAD